MRRGLTEAQRRVLATIAARDDGLSTPQVSRICGARFDDWSRGKLIALEERGLVQRLNMSWSGGQCWGATPAGRAALSDHGGRPDG